MGFDAVIRSGVKIAHSLTGSLQCEVQHQRWIGQTLSDPKYAPANVTRKAILEPKSELRRTTAGHEVMSKHKLMILEPVEAHPALGRSGPIDARDIFILPGGINAPVLEVAGVTDPDSQQPYFYEVWLGEGVFV